MTTVDKHAPGTVSWLDLMAPDPDKARAFYQALFGWSYQIGPAETGHYAIAQVGGRSAAGIGTMPPDSPFPAAWTIYFSVDDAEAAAARIREHRGQVVMGPMDVMEEGRLVFCIDPTGAPFGMWQPRRHIGAQVIDEPGAKCWAEVFTADLAAARAFYAAVFELEPRAVAAPGVHYWVLYKGDRPACGVAELKVAPVPTSAHWMPYFAVVACDATVQKAIEEGGAVQRAATDTSVGRMAWLADPWGASFSVIQPASKA
jgi:predicted enzyme related to lactoylglutathione lyase